jgi:hypothetical protein
MKAAASWRPTWANPRRTIGGVTFEASWDFLVAEHGEPPGIAAEIQPFIRALADVLVTDLLRRPRLQ